MRFLKPFRRQDHRSAKAIHLTVEDVLKAVSPQTVIEPVWLCVSIYDGYERYNADLEAFTLPQRHVFAIQWYAAEVNNGGHDQFFYNSTGIVWEDALTGLREVGHTRAEALLREAVQRLGGNPPFHRDQRQELLEETGADFHDLDTEFYEITDLDETLLAYIQSRAEAFRFSGEAPILE